MEKLVSRRHFERVKPLFGVETPAELKGLIDASAEKVPAYYGGVDTFGYHIPLLGRAVSMDAIASIP